MSEFDDACRSSSGGRGAKERKGEGDSRSPLRSVAPLLMRLGAKEVFCVGVEGSAFVLKISEY